MDRVYLADEDDLVIEFGEQLDVITTAHLSGLVRSDRVVVHRVTDGPELLYPERVKQNVRERLGLGQEVPVMLTAVDVASYVSLRGSSVSVVATVGLSNASCANMKATYEPLRPSTINLVMWSYERLTTSAMIDLLRTVAEAKSAAVADIGLRCDGGRATGTVTDAIAIAAIRDDSRGYMWAGPATTIGSEASALTYRSLVLRAPGPAERLRELLGLTMDELVEDGMKLYRQAPVPDVPEERVRALLTSEVNSLLSDPNVWTFIIAARELDIVGASGLIPGLTAEEHAADSKRIVADELLATALSLYINGFRALTATYWADTTKDRAGLQLAALPMFEDDVAAALVASALSRVYDRLLRGA